MLVHIPLDSGQVDYIYDWKSYPVPRGSGVVWDSGKTRTAGEGLGLFKNQLVPYFWMGNSQRGLSWFIESDEGWQDGGKPVWTLTRDGKTLELTVRVIMGQTKKQDFRLDFSLMVNPIKQIDRAKSQAWQYCGMAREVWESGANPDTIYNGQIPGYVDRKDVLMFFTDDELQSYVTDEGYSGAVREASGDYLMVDVSNIKGAKADAVTDTTVKLESWMQDGTMIHRMTLTTEPWLSCDDCFDQLDAVVERVLMQAGAMEAAFRVHLMGCSVCREEATSLATLVAPDHGLDPSRAAALLDAAVDDHARSSRP